MRGKSAHGIPVLGMHGKGVAAALEGQDFHALTQHCVFAFHNIKCQHRAELFHGVGTGGARLVLPGHQHLCVPRHGKARLLGQNGGRFAHNFRVQGAVGPEQQLSQGRRLSLIHKVEAPFLSLGNHLMLHAFLHNDALLRSADRTVVKGLGAQNTLHRLPHIRAVVDVGRTVSGTHADGRLAGGIGGADHTGAAGGEDQFYLQGFHQLLAALQRRDRKTLDRILGSACLLRRLCHDSGCLPGAVYGLGVGRKDDAAPRLQGNDGLVAHRGGGIGAGHNGSNDPHGYADLPDSLLLFQDTHCLHIPDSCRHGFRGKAVLCGLVLHIAKAGLPLG